ncbi:MAG TPA: hypothetical protein VGJ16_08650, partial [Pirellulales bacterium]
EPSQSQKNGHQASMITSTTKARQRQLIPQELPEQSSEQLRLLRKLSFEERGRMIVAACQLAADIEAGKRKMGLPPSRRDPIPTETLEFFRQRIANGCR